MLWSGWLVNSSLQRKWHSEMRTDSFLCQYLCFAPYWLFAIFFHWLSQARLLGHFQAERIAVSVSLMFLACLAVKHLAGFKRDKNEIWTDLFLQTVFFSQLLLSLFYSLVMSCPFFVGSCVVSCLLSLFLFFSCLLVFSLVNKRIKTQRARVQHIYTAGFFGLQL